jgi:hypothetical protein
VANAWWIAAAAEVPESAWEFDAVLDVPCGESLPRWRNFNQLRRWGITQQQIDKLDDAGINSGIPQQARAVSHPNQVGESRYEPANGVALR